LEHPVALDGGINKMITATSIVLISIAGAALVASIIKAVAAYKAAKAAKPKLKRQRRKAS
jgi:hypothetical protein